MRTRIVLLILLAVAVQLLTYFASLFFGGGFRELEEYTYSNFAENAESGSTWLWSELRQKPAIVLEYAQRLDRTVDGILRESGASISDLQTDGDLAQSVIEASASIVSGLLRRSTADDSFLILDTGNLYAGEDGSAKAALYLQKADSSSGQESGALQMLLGPSTLAQSFGFVPHSDWTEHFMPDAQEGANFSFYETPLMTARNDDTLTQSALGYWSVFSKVTPSAASSMKYSLPLIAEDGTVYGVLGIGIRRITVLSQIPSPNEGLCYVLGYGDMENGFSVLTRSGAAYSTLLGNADTLRAIGEEAPGVYRLEQVANAQLLGSVQDMGLYGPESPYAGERWALICVADSASVLSPIQLLRQKLIVAAVLSVFAVIIVAVAGSGAIVKPLFTLTKQIRAKRKYNELIRFQPSNIYEIDDISDAITQMQINVHGFSSQVSKMVTIADVGLGTFMYDRTDDSVFVGQSLIKVLKLDLAQGEDIMMSRREFLDSIRNPEIRALIAAGLGMADGKAREDLNEVHQVNRLNGGTLWLRLGFTYSSTTAIGTVQDVTDTMLEKQRIEHERDYDQLTGLLTRHAYYRRIEKLFQDRDALAIAAFVMVDLDNLKYVNDTYGHAVGDAYIKTAAAALQKFENNSGIVARLSGDEFNICLPFLSSKDEAREIIESVRTELLQGSCLLPDGTHYRVSASMGVSWYPDDAESREQLMKYADFAMYTVKHTLKGGIAEFDINSYISDSAKLADLKELNRIIETSAVRYAFQSIVSVKTGTIYGYEALMRVQSDVFKSPIELLSIAKSNERLHDIERLTWTRALPDFQRQIDAGHIEKDARLFVNSIANHKLDDEVVAAIEQAHPDLRYRVVMELLENENADQNSTAHKSSVVQKWGGQIALDDYGTGYNSEYALLNLQPNIVKVDRSIISCCDQDSDRRMIIENLVKLTHTKDILVLAEGVETEAEMQTVISCGVDFLQGYYLARPQFEPAPLDPKLTEAILRMAAAAAASEEDN